MEEEAKVSFSFKSYSDRNVSALFTNRFETLLNVGVASWNILNLDDAVIC